MRLKKKMIKIQQSKTADTRSCDFSKVSKEQLHDSSVQHIEDIAKGIEYFKELLTNAGKRHDSDKLTDIEGFHSDFITGFKETGWWDRHRTINRHHLLEDDGVPNNVNLVDVLDMVIDCVMAGMGRTGSVYPLDIKPEVLMKAFQNTVDLMKSQVVVEKNNDDEDVK